MEPATFHKLVDKCTDRMSLISANLFIEALAGFDCDAVQFAIGRFYAHGPLMIQAQHVGGGRVAEVSIVDIVNAPEYCKNNMSAEMRKAVCGAINAPSFKAMVKAELANPIVKYR